MLIDFAIILIIIGVFIFFPSTIYKIVQYFTYEIIQYLISKNEVETLKTESEREKVEKYNTWKIEKLAFIPFILWLWGACYVIYLSYSNSNIHTKWEADTLNMILWFWIVLFLLFQNFNKTWERKLKAKKQLNEAGELKYKFNYNLDCFYTDYLLTYITYHLIKIILFLVNIISILLILFRLFWFLTSLSPTSIIICLLVYIALQVGNKNR